MNPISIESIGQIRENWPAYHFGPYIEEMVDEDYRANPKGYGRKFIPCMWTAYRKKLQKRLCPNLDRAVQQYLDGLPPDRYFTISMCDQGWRGLRLPANTLTFTASANNGQVCLPLIARYSSEMLAAHSTPTERDIFASFQGRFDTHPLRVTMARALQNRTQYLIIDTSKRHSQNMYAEQHHQSYIETMRRSKFVLAPRGYNPSSARFYEAILWGAVPIYVYDDLWLAYTDEIDWTQCSLLVPAKQVSTLPQIVEQADLLRLQNQLKVVAAKLTYDYMLDYIRRKTNE